MKDNILNVEYSLETWNINILSKMLKETLRLHYSIENFSSYSEQQSKDNIKNEHPEIYEYQTFFLLKRLDGSYLLLDGFRRLLLYNDLPDFNVDVRVYNESDLTKKQLLRLVLMLNHTKFFGKIGNYYDKGFNLLFSILFGFDIIKFSKVFEGYVIFSQETTDGRYCINSENDNKNKLSEIRERLLLDKTIEDLQFLYSLYLEKPFINKFNYLGSLIFNYRQKYPDVVFSLEMFKKLSNTNDIIKLEENCPSPNGAREADHVNKLMEFYINIVKVICGEVIDETYVEALNRVKLIKLKLKKDKKLIHLTKQFDSHKKINLLNDLVINNKKLSPKLHILVYPSLEYNNIVKPGVYDGVIDNVQISSHLLSTNVKIYSKIVDSLIDENILPELDLICDPKYSSDLSYKFNSKLRKNHGRNNCDIFVSLDEYSDSVVTIKDLRGK